MALGVPNIAVAGVAIRPDVSGFKRKLEQSLPAPLAAAGAAAGGVLVASLGAAIGSAKVFGGFETTLARIVGLVGIAKGEVDKMGESLKELGPAVGIGPDKLAEALFFVTSAGLRGADAMETVEAAAKASAAGLGEIADIADAATSAMNAYGSETLGASEATDVLVATVREGKLEASSLAGAIGRVIPIASEAGISFNEVGAAIAAMSRTGLDANEAITALRGLLATIVNPTAQARDTLAEFGLSAQILRDTVREGGLLEVMQLMTDRFGDNADALNTVIPNVRAVTGFLSLMGQNAESTVDIFRNLEDVTGITDEALAAVADTTEFRVNQQFARLKTELIDVGADAAPAMVDAMIAFTDVAVEVLPALVAIGTQLLQFAGDTIPPAVSGISELGLAWGFLAESFQERNIFGDPESDANDFNKLLFNVSKDITARHIPPVLALANRLVQFSGSLTLTSEGLGTLQRLAGLNSEEMGILGQQLLRAAQSGQEIGFTTQELLDLFGEFPGVAQQFAISAAGSDVRFIAMAASAEEARLAIEGVDDVDIDFAIVEEELTGLAKKFAEAIAEGTGLRDVLLGIADPVFAAVDSFDQYQETLEEVDKDGKRTSRETLELGKAALVMAASFEAAGVNTSEALQVISAATGLSIGEVIALLDDIGIQIDGSGIGTDIGDGIIEGIDGLAERLLAAINGEIDTALGGVRIHNLIESPSRLWADAVGLPISEGIAMGISGGGAAIQAALASSIPVPSAQPLQGRSFRGGDVTIINPNTTDLARDLERANAIQATHFIGRDLVGIE